MVIKTNKISKKNSLILKNNFINSHLTVIGGGIFGCYSAYYFAKKNPNLNVILIEKENDLMNRASFINQARVHFGYHYPRSISTALSSAKYFNKFSDDFKFAINRNFTKIYGISSNFTLTNSDSFELFCENAKIPAKKISVSNYFNKHYCSSAYETLEYSFDALSIKNFFYDEFKNIKNIKLLISEKIEGISDNEENFIIKTNKNTIKTNFILNCAYSEINNILGFIGKESLKLNYELCEIILCSTNENLKNVGITLMDGPFFSAMPFGLSGYHSLSSVEYTPHFKSSNITPTFNCQLKAGSYCKNTSLGNCNNCNFKPKTNFSSMSKVAQKYLNDKLEFKYEKSLFTIKTIPQISEIDDSRPTLISYYPNNQRFISVLSGKINTIYDLCEVLDNVRF